MNRSPNKKRNMQIEKGYKSPQRNLRYVHSKMAGKNSVY